MVRVFTFSPNREPECDDPQNKDIADEVRMVVGR